jgi:hypothetical protein
MLDAFEIFTTSGVVLWSRSTSRIGASAVNSLINDVFIEERVRPTTTASSNPTYKYDRYTLKYTLVKDLGLIFVVCRPHLHPCNAGPESWLTVCTGRLSVAPPADLGRPTYRRCPHPIRPGLQRPVAKAERDSLHVPVRLLLR